MKRRTKLKTLFYLLGVYFLLINIAYTQYTSQGDCGTDCSQLPNTPNYLESNLINVKRIKVAILYVDFPDGRKNRVDQPFYDEDLSQISDTDAAAEVGLRINEFGDTVPVCSKYTYFDRWNMYFDSLGNYIATAHPDFTAHGDSAWGSFKEYWSEVSNNKLIIEPALIRPNAEGDSKFRTGLINNYRELEPGKFVIKSIRLRKDKYARSGPSSGYFTTYPFADVGGYSPIKTDALELLDSLRISDPHEYTFNHRQFLNEGGKIIIVFAGGASGIGGAADNSSAMVVRGRGYPLINRPDIFYAHINWLKNSTIDAIGISVHEFGHDAFRWRHTYAARYDVMNGNTVWNVNCPPHPNPIYKMQQGWVQPIAIENSQQLANLMAIENSYQCGVITIFGKPSAAPNWSTGESYVVENRRMLKFDRKLIDTSFFRQNPQWGVFTGGLLVWHYSPYNVIHWQDIGVDQSIRLRTPNLEDTTLGGNRSGDVRHFFAFLPFSIIQDPIYYNFLQSRTYSGGGLQTGIELRNISQSNNNINLNINYTIARPRQYSDVIYFRDYNRHVVNYFDTVFYHSRDTAGFFSMQPGTIVEHPGGFFNVMEFRGLEAKGAEVLPITFGGVGYTSQKTKYRSIIFSNVSSYSFIDSLILNNIKVQDINTFNGSSILQIGSGGLNINPTPVLLKNIELPISNIDYEIDVLNSTISKIELVSRSIQFLNKINFDGNVNLENGRVSFNGSNFLFNGLESYLNLKLVSNVNLKDSLTFKNGSHFSAIGSTFDVFYPLTIWSGIKLENSGIDSIVNCTFNNAKTALSFINQSSSYTNRVIKNNTFNIPPSGVYRGIYGENNYKMLIQDNTFNMQPVLPGQINSVGIYLKNSSIIDPTAASGIGDEEDLATPFSLNIIHNTFNNGSASLIMANYTSNLLSYNIINNTFNSAATLNLLGMKMIGTIKDNVFTSMSTPMGIHLVSSSPNLYKNVIASKKVSLHLVGSCFPNLAPYIFGNQLVWSGGRNTLSSDSSDNIQMAVPGNVYSDWGNNSFLTPLSAYHIYGWIVPSETTYYSRNNCWYSPGSTFANISLRKNHSTPPIPTVTSNNGYNCNTVINPNGWNVDYLGNGIYDSTMLSPNNTGSQPSEAEILLNQGYDYIGNAFFLDAIASFKLLINNHPGIEDPSRALYDLYACYTYLDTNSEQSYRNTLYGNLKLYLEEKISSVNYNQEFKDVAYDIILMCEAQLENYNDAMNGYEFIALFHPDPDIRLIASWNYAEIEALLNSGSGGGVSNKLRIKNEKLRIEELEEDYRIIKIISNDPIMRRMKESFEKTSTERKDKIEKQISDMSKDKAAMSNNLRKANELDKIKVDKARKNLSELSSLNPEDLERRRLEDMFISTRSIKEEIQTDEILIIPAEYKLSQNYPNPFNPVTTISYQIPRDGFVKIKVYDITGKEVSILVNEFKNAGSFSITFDGSNLASGVYFYEIEVEGDHLISSGQQFVITKRMVLIK